MATKTLTEADNIRRVYFYDDRGVLKRLEETSLLNNTKTGTDFSFDTAGRVETVKSEGWSRNLAYADKGSTRIKNLNTSYGVEESVYAFEYDDNERLVSARHTGTEVRITYQAVDKPEIASLQTKNHKLKIIRDHGRVVRLDLESQDGNGSLTLNRPMSGNMKIKTNDPVMAYRISSILSGMLVICAQAHANVNLELP